MTVATQGEYTKYEDIPSIEDSEIEPKLYSGWYRFPSRFSAVADAALFIAPDIDVTIGKDIDLSGMDPEK